MAVLYAADGSIIRGVKNLGWMLRNWKTIKEIRVEGLNGKGKDTLSECLLVVIMDPINTPGHVQKYTTVYASAWILWNWLQRPVLFGLPLTWGSLPQGKIEKGAQFPGLPT